MGKFPKIPETQDCPMTYGYGQAEIDLPNLKMGLVKEMMDGAGYATDNGIPTRETDFLEDLRVACLRNSLVVIAEVHTPINAEGDEDGQRV
jgi:hypothetical protein